jgi:hypothetical protein
MLERWLFEEIRGLPWVITISVPEITTHPALFSESPAYEYSSIRMQQPPETISTMK